MDWNRIRNQWQESEAAATPPALADVQERDRKLRRAVRRRDLLETLVALPMIPLFGWVAAKMLAQGASLAGAFALLLTLWCAYVPVHLWRARRRMPPPDPALAPVEYLARERDAMHAQARMLGSVWLWYLAPCMLGVTGLVFSLRGVDAKSLTYAAVVVALGVLIGWANHVAARRHFGTLADDIQKQIEWLTREDPR